MPMYLFRCPCGHETEMLLDIADRDLKALACPKCNKCMKRVPVAATLAKPEHRTQAILGGGRKVSGNWEK